MTIFSPQYMTTATTPVPFVVTESSFFSGLPGWAIFDNDIPFGPYWVTNGVVAGYVALDIGSGNSEIMGSYDITSPANPGEQARAPKDWTIEGSDNGLWAGEEDILDTVTGQTGWSAAETRNFTCDVTTTGYRYFRINVSDNNGDALYTSIQESIFYDFAAPSAPQQPIITILT